MNDRGRIALAALHIALFLAVIAASALPASAAGERLALVIGNGAYERAALANPVHDARDVKTALEAVGFEVIYLEDATEQQMKAAVRDFGRRIQSADVRLFYYAGHGVQTNGQNYLIPVDVNIEVQDEVEFDSVESNRVLRKMEEAGDGMNLVFLDACRDNPFSRTRGGSRGLAIVHAPRGSIISYATAPGKTAEDGTARNSPYSKHLAQLIRQPDLGIEALLKELRRRVARETGNQQVPWDHSSLLDDFYFVPGGQEARPQPSPSPTPVGCPPGQVWRGGACAEAPGLGRIVVRSNVTGDLVKIDGQPVGPSGPGGWNVLPGQHVVSVHKAGYVTAERTVSVAAGENETLAFALSPPDSARIAPPTPTSEGRPAPRRLRPDPDREYDVPIGDSPVRGNAAAPVTIVEFADFQCPFSYRARSTLERIQKTYGDEVKIVFKHLPIRSHREAPAAHAAAEAAKRQGRFWEMHDLIFASQRQLSEEKYVAYARQIGLEVARFNRDRRSQGVQARLDADGALAGELGVHGTPTFFVNGKALSGAQPFEKFKSKIDAELRATPRRRRADTD